MTDLKEFGLPPKEDAYEKYINGYYICSPIGAEEKYVGRIKQIDAKEGKITFNPYFGTTYDKINGKNLYSLIGKDYDAFIDLRRISFEPTTKEGILYNCGLGNSEKINGPNSNKQKSRSLFEIFKSAYRILMNKND